MFLTQAKIATTFLLTVSLLAGGAGIITHRALAGRPAAQETTPTQPTSRALEPAAKNDTAKAEAPPTKQESQDVVAFAGRVLDPDGQAVAGA